MKISEIDEEELQIIYEKGKKAVIIDCGEFKEIMNKLKKGTGRIDDDPLIEVIGICEGPSDLAENHDRYIYGNK